MANRRIDIEQEIQGQLTVVTLNGALDSSNLRHFKNELDPLLNEEERNVLLDCSHLTYASSQVFGLFSCYNKTAKTKGKHFGLCNLNPQMYNILDILGLVPMFQIFDSRDAALQELNNLIKEQ